MQNRIENNRTGQSGTTFKICLPAEAGFREKPPGECASESAAQRNETILLVEDEDPVRQVTALLLESLRYRVLQVSSAEEAILLMQANGAGIDLLFTDVEMPGMSGRELADALRARDPFLKVLFQSGYTDDSMVRNRISSEEVAFLHKPFSLKALSKKVREVLDQRVAARISRPYNGKAVS
jgi:two-component system, cell cycle sensor histidine kinase and response regulator CckA